MSSAYSMLNAYDTYGSDYSPKALLRGAGSSGGTTVNSSGFSHNSGSFAPNYDYAGSDYSLTSGKATAGGVGELNTANSSSDDNNGLDPNGVDWIGYYENGLGSSANAELRSTDLQLPYDFMDTSLASIFGMDASTHYQEALANTAYQRAVRDLKAAGLNPVLGISGNGASVFPGSEASPSGSGSGSGSGYGSLTSAKSNIGDIAYKLGNVLPGLANAAASVGVIMATKGKGFSYAPAVGYAVLR